MAANAQSSTHREAKQALEEAKSRLPNGDPLRDASIANKIAEASRNAATANGEDISDPGVQKKYMLPTSGLSATSSNGDINNMVRQLLNNQSIENVVSGAIYNNQNGTRVADRQNAEATKQTEGTAGTRAKIAGIQTAEEKNADRDAARIAAEGRYEEGRADKLIAGTTRRIDNLQKEYDRIAGDPMKAKTMQPRLAEIQKQIDGANAALDKLQGVDSGKAVDNNIIPQPNQLPPVDQRKDGAVYTNANGKQARWDEKTKTLFPI
jgi:hypothetical protein